jgi:hypothetical protein
MFGNTIILKGVYMNKVVLFCLGFIVGAGAGSVISYVYTKNTCEKRSQEAINEMKSYYKKDKENEENINPALNDKPPISEFSNVLNNVTDNSVMFTDYHARRRNEDAVENEEIDKKVNDIKTKLKINKNNEEDKPRRYAVINKEQYTEKLNSKYLDKDYRYDIEEEQWYDEMAGTEIDIMDLPFDPGIIQWDDLEQCYIVDEHLHSVYMLEKN